MTAGHGVEERKQAVEKRGESDRGKQQRTRRGGGPRLSRLVCGIEGLGTAVDALQQSGRVGSENDRDVRKRGRQDQPQASGRRQTRLCPRLAGAPSLPCRCSPMKCQEVSSNCSCCPPWLERAYRTPIGKSQQSICICPLITHTPADHPDHSTPWPTHPQCNRPLYPAPDARVFARVLILIVTAVYTAGHSSWPSTGPSTDTSGEARPCTFAPSSKPTPTSASPDSRE